MKRPVDAVLAKRKVLDYCLRKGALCAGMADLDAINRVAPAGHRPADLMPKVKSVISIGVGGNTRGAWGVSAKALTFFGSTEGRPYKIAYGLAFYIEHTFGIPAVYCPPDMDSEAGARVPFQSLKLHAELAGLGARLHRAFPPPRRAAEGKSVSGSVVRRHVPRGRQDALHEVLSGSVPLGQAR